MHIGIIKGNDPWIVGSNEYLIDFLKERHRVSIYSGAEDLGQESPDIFWTRAASDNKRGLVYVAQYLEMQGAKPLNREVARATMANKHLSQIAFAQAGLPQPAWIALFPSHQEEHGSWNGKTILKPSFGGGGDNISIHEDIRQALSKTAGSESALWIMQPYIENIAVWRVIVGSRNGIISSYKKVGDSDIVAVSHGAKREYASLPDEAAQLSKDMLRAVGGNLAGMDLLETEEGFLALEANYNFDFDYNNKNILTAIEQEITEHTG